MTMTMTNEKTMTMTMSHRRDFRQLILTFLTIENNNINFNIEPSIKSDRGQHLQFL